MPAMSVENIKQHGRRAARIAFATDILPFYRAQRGTGERGKSRLSPGLMLAVGARKQRWTNPNFDIRLVLFLGGYAERNTKPIRISELTN
jgi:hypothetical protein